MPFKKCITQIFQVLIYVVCLYTSYYIQCPHSSQWNLRALNDCNATSQYYCLFDEHSFMYKEFCRRTPDFEGPGYKVVILGGLNGRICAHGRYQPFIFWTNGSSKCTFQKSLCREEGQMIVTEQSASKDTTCRCDYARGYSFFLQPKNITYCVPSEEDCSCYRKQCPDGHMLNAGYQCIAGSLSNNGSTTSDPFISSKNKSTEMKVLTVNTESDRIVFTREKTVPAILVLIILALIVTMCYNIPKADNDTTNCIDKTEIQDTPKILVEEVHALQPVVEKQQTYLEYAKEGTYEDSFIITKAFSNVYETIKNTKITVISGPPGCGKTAMSYHAAMKLGETDNHSICFVSNPMKLIESINRSSKQIFVLDDIVGKCSLNENSLQTWGAEAHSIKRIISQSLNTKLILTCRSYIYRNERFSLLKLPHIHCDMLADDMLMTKEERQQICSCHVSEEETQSLHDSVLILYNFFPLICSQYEIQHHKNINDYFLYPNDIIENEMNELRLSSDPCFIALALLVIYNNNIDKRSLMLYDHKETSEFRIIDVLNDLLQDIDYGCFISLKGISSSLSHLENIYVEETFLTFTCINKSMFDMLVGTVGRHFIPCILKHSNSEFIKDYIELVPFSTDRNPHTIQIESKYENLYFRRIIDDINNGLNWDVFETVQMERKEYRLYFLENILKTERPTYCKSKKDGSTPLHVTSLLGYNDLSLFFVENYKSQVNSRDNTGKTPLHMACSKGNVVVAKLLIKHNAEVNQMDTKKVTPFMLACSSGNIHLIKFLLAKQVNINGLNLFGSNPLLDACIRNNFKVFSLLLQNYASVDCFNKNGDTPLHLACQSGQTTMVNLLIKYNIHTCINKPNVKGYTPFYLALSTGHNEIANILFENGAKPNSPNKNGDTPLHLACQSGHTKLVNLLIKYNVDTCINTPNINGYTPFDLALSNGHKEIAKILSRMEVTQIYETKMD